MTRRQIDDEATDPAFAHRGELIGDDVEVPVHRQLCLWVEVTEAAPGKSAEVPAQKHLALGPS
jgi:hypothetical protein